MMTKHLEEFLHGQLCFRAMHCRKVFGQESANRETTSADCINTVTTSVIQKGVKIVSFPPTHFSSSAPDLLQMHKCFVQEECLVERTFSFF
jgi:hypothetical protein